MKRTSDGIPIAEWNKIVSYSGKITDCVLSNKSSEAVKMKERMMKCLGTLECKYGEKPWGVQGTGYWISPKSKVIETVTY